MLNYIWLGLIVVAIIIGLGYDIHDEVVNTYRNGQEFTATIDLGASIKLPLSGTQHGSLQISGRSFALFYGLHAEDTSLIVQPVTLTFSDEATNRRTNSVATIVISLNSQTPKFWLDMAQATGTKTTLAGTVTALHIDPVTGIGKVSFVLTPVSFVKMRKITQAAVDYAGTAVTIALGLIGIMAMWLGIMKIAEQAGIIKFITKLVTPITKRLFPDVPQDHPAIGAMIMNISANMLGLSNAATPLGLKAMEELDKLNKKKGTATNAMVTFLAINTAGLTLIPATAIAIRASLGSMNPTVIVGTSIFGASCATIVGITTAKLLEKLPVYRRALEPEAESDNLNSKEKRPDDKESGS
jgi:spore maturation protein A